MGHHHLPCFFFLAPSVRSRIRRKHLYARHSGLKQAEGRFRQSKDALAAISKDDEGRRMLVPLTQSLYVPGELGDPDQLLVELGTGYYIERSKPARPICSIGRSGPSRRTPR